VTASPDESFCCIPNDSRSSGACPGPFFQEDRLDSRLENLKIKNIRRRKKPVASPRVPGELRRTQAASISHSGSACDFQNLPPVCTGSPPASCARGWSRRGLLSGSLGVTNWETNSKFCRGLFLCPRRIPRQEGLQSKASGERGMTVVAAHSAFTLLEKNRLDESAVLVEVEREIAFVRLPPNDLNSIAALAPALDLRAKAMQPDP